VAQLFALAGISNCESLVLRALPEGRESGMGAGSGPHHHDPGCPTRRFSTGGHFCQHTV